MWTRKWKKSYFTVIVQAGKCYNEEKKNQNSSFHLINFNLIKSSLAASSLAATLRAINHESWDAQFKIKLAFTAYTSRLVNANQKKWISRHCFAKMKCQENCASSSTLTSLIAAFSSSPWRAGLFPVSFMDRPKSIITHVPSPLTRTFRLFRSLWDTAGLYKSERRREGSGMGKDEKIGRRNKTKELG